MDVPLRPDLQGVGCALEKIENSLLPWFDDEDNKNSPSGSPATLRASA